MFLGKTWGGFLRGYPELQSMEDPDHAVMQSFVSYATAYWLTSEGESGVYTVEPLPGYVAQ